MLLDTFQATCGEPANRANDLILLLQLGASAGTLARVHGQYLTDSLDHTASSLLIERELSEILRDLAALCTSNGLDLSQVATGNLIKSRDKFANNLDWNRVPSPHTLTGAQYQALAKETDQQANDGFDPLGLSVPVLGLSGEVGTLHAAQKKLYRDHSPQASDPDFLSEELGDILWYATTMATHSGLNLDDLLVRACDRDAALKAEVSALSTLPRNLAVLDAAYPPVERFPRKITIRVQQRQNPPAHASVTLSLVSASPNHFPNGPIVYWNDKLQGYAIAQSMGDNLTDNSRRIDNYRFHDAIHLAFMAVLGWSPLVRSLFQLKRRSDPITDDVEDGARALFAEEGIAAILAKRASSYQGFLTEQAVDDETVDMIITVIADLEVAVLPPWLWKRAISHGFRAMRALANGPGGFLVANLDDRTLTYQKTVLTS